MRLNGHPVWQRKVWQVIFAKRHREIAPLRNQQRISNCLWKIGKLFDHFGLSHEALLLRESLRSTGVSQRITLGDTNSRLVRFVVIRRGELHRVCRYDRHPRLRRETH